MAEFSVLAATAKIVDFTIVKRKAATKESAAVTDGAARGPVSVLLPSPLRAAVAAEAKRRGLKLSTAIRALVSERIRMVEESEELTQAEQWQRAQAWATWQKIQSGNRHEVSEPEIDAVFDQALTRSRRRRG